MEEFPKVRKPYGSKLISIRIYEAMTECFISVGRAELLCERLRIVLEAQRLQKSYGEILAFSGTDEKADVEINEIDDADHFGQVHDRISRLSKILDQRTGEIENNFANEIDRIDKRQHRLESSSESAIGTTWRNMTALEEVVLAANERLLTRISALEKANTDGACTATEPVARDCDTCAFSIRTWCVCGADVPGLGECQQCGETGSGCSNPPCSNHSKWEPATRKALGKPPGTDFGYCGGNCGMCRHDIHCDDDCVLASLFVCDASRCDECKHDLCDDCKPGSVFESAMRTGPSVDGCIIYKHEFDDDECDTYIGIRTHDICVPWYCHIGDARNVNNKVVQKLVAVGISESEAIEIVKDIRNPIEEISIKFATVRDAVEYARELGILDDVSFRFVKGEVKGDGVDGEEIGVGDLVSRGGSGQVGGAGCAGQADGARQTYCSLRCRRH